MGSTKRIKSTLKFVGAIIEHPQKGYLLQQRYEHAPTFPLYWTLFGGKVESGESPKTVILRELEEELNLAKTKVMQCRPIQRNIQPNGAIQIIYHIQTSADLSDFRLMEGKQLKYIEKKDIF